SVLALWSPQCNAESWRKGIMTRIEMLHPRSFHAALQAFTEIQRKRFDQHFIAFAKRLQRRPLARTFGSLWPFGRSRLYRGEDAAKNASGSLLRLVQNRKRRAQAQLFRIARIDAGNKRPHQPV